MSFHFLEDGTICASLQPCGTVPWLWENWYNLVNTSASSSAASLNIAVDMLPGPVALRVFNWESCLRTPLVLNKIPSIDGYGLGLLSGM